MQILSGLVAEKHVTQLVQNDVVAMHRARSVLDCDEIHVVKGHPEAARHFRGDTRHGFQMYRSAANLGDAPDEFVRAERVGYIELVQN
ncbi:hypothetical protein [Streptomyces coelicoflavus]|uniref:hypothetical protein n=1 Tax=Streptomyces coelicoflavus TaxID=285562 RepID=UPI0036BCA98C